MLPEEGDALDIGIGPAPSVAPAEESPEPSYTEPTEQTADADPHTDTAQANYSGDPAEPTDWTTVDFRRQKEEDFPETDRATFRHLQDREKALQRDQTARVNDVARREREAKERETRLQAQETQRQVDDRIDARLASPQTQDALTIKDLLGRHDLDDDVRETLTLMDKEMDDRVAAALKPYESILEKFPTIEQSVTAQNHNAEQGRHDTLVTSLNDARTKYPNLDQRASEVLRIVGVRLANGRLVQAGSAMTNYATGEPHTFTSAYELISGIATDEVLSARAEDEQIRSDAQAKASQVSGPSSRPPRSEMSDTEVREEVSSIRSRMTAGA